MSKVWVLATSTKREYSYPIGTIAVHQLEEKVFKDLIKNKEATWDYEIIPEAPPWFCYQVLANTPIPTKHNPNNWQIKCEK